VEQRELIAMRDHTMANQQTRHGEGVDCAAMPLFAAQI
jgi:hypothetical protein